MSSERDGATDAPGYGKNNMSRRVGETVMIGDDVTITVLGMMGNQVRVDINAPTNMALHREEIYDRIKREQQSGGQGQGIAQRGCAAMSQSYARRTRYAGVTGCLVVGALLGACSHSSIPEGPQTVDSDLSAAAGAEVLPKVLRGTKSVELGELLLLPDNGQSDVPWSFRADSPIKWQTAAAYEEAPKSDIATRLGWIRVNVQGRTSKILRQKKLELGWTVEYSNSDEGGAHLPPKFGVQRITIQPGSDGALACFGTGFYGCDFKEPIASLVNAGIDLQTICSRRTTDGHISAFLLTYPGRRPTVMKWTESGGSGGLSSWITLELNAAQRQPQETAATDPDMYDQGLCKE